MITAWSKILNKLMDLLKWLWVNKWTMLFMCTTIVFLSMYGCQKHQVTKLTDQITVIKAEVITCKSNYDTIKKTYKTNNYNYELCLNELSIITESRKNVEVINKTFEKEIANFKDMSKKLDDITDEDELFNKKKEILEKLFNGKNMVQIYRGMK